MIGSPSVAPDPAHVRALYQNLPLTFEPNLGQTDRQVRFLARGSGYTLFLTESEAVLVLRAPGTERTQRVVRLRFLKTMSAPVVRGEGELPGKSHYFIGNDPGRWRTAVPHFERVVYRNLYPGIDLVFYGRQQEIEFDLVLHPSADPASIVLAIDGAPQLRTNEHGDLLLGTQQSELMLKAPTIYQDAQGLRKTVSGRYVLKGKNRVGFELGSYDRTRKLVIDPTLNYSTFLGGTNSDSGNGVTVDTAGNIYVTGKTESLSFPLTTDTATTKAAFQSTNRAGPDDAFIAKLNPSAIPAEALLYSTFLGGTNSDVGNGIAVDSSGNVYVTGRTESADFPLSTDSTFSKLPFQNINRGAGDAFITKLSPTAISTEALLYSTFLGGTNSDTATSIAINSSGHVFITGKTESANFPLSTATATTKAAFQSTNQAGPDDVFITKLNPSVIPAEALLYSTFLGGTNSDVANGIAVDSSGNVYVTGRTESTNFPLSTETAISEAPFQSTNRGAGDAFITKLNPTAIPTEALLDSTFLGGTNSDTGNGIVVNSAGHIFVTGKTESTNFPLSTATSTTKAPFQGTNQAGPDDVFITKFVPTSDSSSGSQIGPGSGGGGCFIATAAFGSPLAKEVQTLRAFRDRYLLTSGAGRLLVEGYYRVSPPLAAAIASHDAARTLIRFSLTPVIWYAKVALWSPLLALVTASSMILLTAALIRPRRRK